MELIYGKLREQIYNNKFYVYTREILWHGSGAVAPLKDLRGDLLAGGVPHQRALLSDHQVDVV